MNYATETAKLRPIRADDARISEKWRNDPAVRDPSLGFRFPVTAAMEDRWIAGVLLPDDNTRVMFAVEDATDGVLVGFVYLQEIEWIARHAAFGILLGDRSRHSRGIGTDALRIMLRFGFEMLNLQKIHLTVAASNARARKLYEREGFHHDGTLRRHIFLDGAYHDLVQMSLLLEEYRPHPAQREQSDDQ
jgi:RimJ/RimL family protein N-acetyltransferase